MLIPALAPHYDENEVGEKGVFVLRQLFQSVKDEGWFRSPGMVARAGSVADGVLELQLLQMGREELVQGCGITGALAGYEECRRESQFG